MGSTASAMQSKYESTSRFEFPARMLTATTSIFLSGSISGHPTYNGTSQMSAETESAQLETTTSLKAVISLSSALCVSKALRAN